MPDSFPPLRWGILGPGRIAKQFALGVRSSHHGLLSAAGSRDADRARTFLTEVDCPEAHAHGSYEALLADPEVDAVYIATPHPMHVEWAVRTAEAGKHLLIEKPIGLNKAEAMVAIEAAREHGVLLMEAWMYRCHPQTARLLELLREGAIGEIGMVQAEFSFRSSPNPESRLWSNALGGGGILDVGGYPVSYARLIAGALSGMPFANPKQVEAVGRLHPETGVDELTAAVLRFPNGLLAQVACGVGLTLRNEVRIFGSKGWIEIPSPFVIAREASPTEIRLHRDGKMETVVISPDRGIYAYEADTVAEAVAAGLKECAVCTPDDTLGNMAVLDEWRESVGLRYESEKPESFTRTHTGRPLVRRSDAPMQVGKIAGVQKPIARLVMGCDNQRTMPHAAAVWDDYFARGGNAFDTAWLYAGGLMERLLGWWMRHRGVREEVVVIAKGGHTPHCHPEAIETQLDETLDRLQTDYVDIYFLHRDNLALPASVFVDLLDRFVKEGKIRVFGGSNWSIERIAEANAYAAQTGKQGFTALSNNFSLARMVSPVWADCLSASEDAAREWLTEQQLVLFPWSSQARGFFTERAGPDKRGDAELVRCWYSKENFERRERAIQLAKEKKTTPIAIAAAYVLAQPFPTFALFGPRTIAETRSSLECLAVHLTPEEIAWLDLRGAR